MFIEYSMYILQISMLPPQDVSFERTIIGKDLWLLLLDMAAKGPSVVFDRLDLLIPAWCSLLHLDCSGDFHEDVHSRILPPQMPDPLFPVQTISRTPVDIDDEDIRVIQSFKLISACPDLQQRAPVKARTEITRLMNTSYSTIDVHEFVDQVDAQLRTALVHPSTQVQMSIVPDILSPEESGTSPRQAETPCQLPHVINPPHDKIRIDFHHEIFVTQGGRRMSVDVRPLPPPAVLDLPKWVPQDNDTKLHSHSQFLDVFVPEVSPDDDRDILFSQEKIRLRFAWPVAKVRLNG